MTDYNGLIKLVNYFSDKEVCKRHFAKMRWNGNPVCPHCKHKKVYITKVGYKCASPKCRRNFTATTGTFLENTKIPLQKWFVAIYLTTSHKKGISSLQLSRDINVTSKTAWFMLHRIREMIQDKSTEQLEGIIEVDETYVGGKNSNRPIHKKVKYSQGRSYKDKTPVFGMLQRDGKVIARKVPSTSRYTLQPLIHKYVTNGSILVSDEWWAYYGLNAYYQHTVIEHGRKQYAIGDLHTNEIEGFWSHLKRSIFGIYHVVSRKHMDRYCNEFCFRYNTRLLNEQQRFDLALSNVEGRLLYKQLIN